MQLTRVTVPGLLAGLLWCSAAAAQPQTAARTRAMLYQDDDATTVLTAAVEAEANVEDVVGVRAGYLLDAITTASVDVVASATTRWDERRDEIHGGVDVYVDDFSLSANYARSLENDYDSHQFLLGSSLSLADKNTTLSLALGLILSDVGRADDPVFSADQRAMTASLGVTQVLDAATLGAIAYTIQHVDGYQASPYRFVRAGFASFVPEHHPESRLRHALATRLRWGFSDDAVLAVDERLYFDDWAVFGTTTELRLILQVSDAFDFELRDRFHFQTAAYFHETEYDQQRRYMTVDRELSTFLDNYAGPALVFTAEDAGPFSTLRFDVRADFFVYKFFDHAYIENRIGTLVSVGVEGEL